MKQLELGNYLERFTKPVSKISNERQEIIKQFLDALNSDRKGYKPLSPAFISMKMSDAGLKSNHDLYMFLGRCREAKSFGACWWGSLKVKK